MRRKVMFSVPGTQYPGKKEITARVTLDTGETMELLFGPYERPERMMWLLPRLIEERRKELRKKKTRKQLKETDYL